MDPSLRRSLYSLMLVVATGVMVGRIGNVELLYEPSLHTPKPKPDRPGESYQARKWPEKAPVPWPTFSSNDRSRWATVKALVEDGTFVIGRRVPDEKVPKGYTDEGILFPGARGYGSVDVVLNPDTNEFFATKPPLLTVFAAGQYWVLHKVFHRNIDDHKWEVVVPILLVTNVIPLVLALWLFSRLLETYGTDRLGPAVHVRGRLLRDVPADVHDHAQQPRPGGVLRDVRAVCPRRPGEPGSVSDRSSSKLRSLTLPARPCGSCSPACSPGWPPAWTCRPPPSPGPSAS